MFDTGLVRTFLPGRQYVTRYDLLLLDRTRHEYLRVRAFTLDSWAALRFNMTCRSQADEDHACLR